MRKGGVLVESVLMLPILLALLIGTVELARVTYTYHMLQKTMYTLARYLGTQQGVNFCNPEDLAVQAAIDYALTDNPIVGLMPNMIQVRMERYDSSAQEVVACDCSAAGCDASQGALPPGFIAVSLTDGYLVRPVFWGFAVDPFPLRPAVRVPYGGT